MVNWFWLSSWGRLEETSFQFDRIYPWKVTAEDPSPWLPSRLNTNFQNTSGITYLAQSITPWIVCTHASKIEMSPYEALYGRKSDLSNLRALGCQSWFLIPKEKCPTKLDILSQSFLSCAYRTFGRACFQIWTYCSLRFCENCNLHLWDPKDKGQWKVSWS